MVRVTATGLQSSATAATALPKIQWAAAAGTVDVITAAFTPQVTSITDGMILGVRTTGANLTTTPTFNPDGQGAHTIVKNFDSALEPGDLPDEALLRWNQAYSCWTLLNPNGHFRVPTVNWATAGGTVDAITAAFAPTTGALGAAQDGMIFGVRASGANTLTNPTLAIDTFTARIIYKRGGVALLAGDILGANHECLFRFHYDGTTPWFELLNPSTAKPEDPTYGNLYSALTADGTVGSNVNTAQPWFAANATFTVKAATYEFRGKLYLSRAAGNTAHTTASLFGGTAAITAISGVAKGNDGDETGTTLTAFKSLWFAAATATVVKGSSVSTTEQIVIEVEGTVTFSGVGTFIPQYQFSAAPGGAGTPKKGSYFSMRYISSNPQGAVA